MNAPISEGKIEIQRPNIFHFKAFGMTNLQYEIRSPQKINNIVTIIENVYYENYWNRL